jgi:hypothetical protein
VIDTDEVHHWSDFDDMPQSEYYETVAKSFSVEEFYCPACELHFFGTEEIAAAGMPEEFTTTEERERQFEEEYNNE